MRPSIKRRRQEAKTDYVARIALLKSGKPRLVVRKTNKYIYAQIVVTEIAQDRTIFTCTSKELLGTGWPESNKGSLKSLQAAYLTGFMIGEQAKKKISEAILDLGLQRNIQKSRLYAVVKGAIDAGLKIPHSPESLPDESTLQRNVHLRELLNKMHKKK